MDKQITISKADRQAYDLIDIFKFIASLLVVAIHCNPFSDFNHIIDFALNQYVARIAVPFFFISSSYFCFKKTNEKDFNIKVTNSYALRMIALYSVWFVIYFIPKFILNGIHISYIKSYILGYYHLWYLLASAFAISLIGIMLYKKMSIRAIFILATILYMIGLLGETYYGLIFSNKNMFYTYSSRNGLFFAPIFIVFGILFAYKKVKIKASISLIFVAIFGVLWAIEVAVLCKTDIAREYNMSLFMVPTTFFVFNILVNANINIRFNTQILRKISGYIYFVHVFVLIYIIPIATNIIGILINRDICLNSLEKYITTVLFSIVISLIIIKFQKIKGLKRLKFLS